jgi:uncharacterized membrane protein
MANRILDDYLAAVRRQLGSLPRAQRDEVLRDIRSHLGEKVRELRQADSRLSADEAMLQATHDFGDPADLGVAYGASGGVVRKSTGEVLLRVAALTGKAAGGVLKWIVIAILVLVALAVVAGIAVLFVAGGVLVAYQDEIASSVPRPIYGYSEEWDLASSQAAMRTDAFQVSTDATGFDLLVDIRPEAGCLPLIVFAPDGTQAYSNGQGCQDTGQHLHFSQQGTWRIQYTFVAFSGSVDVAAFEYRTMS